jgi:hypothetical protein
MCLGMVTKAFSEQLVQYIWRITAVNSSLLLRTNTSFSITFCVDHYTIDILYIDSFASPSKRPSINKVYGRLLPCFQWRPITQGVVWPVCQLAKAF